MAATIAHTTPFASRACGWLPQHDSNQRDGKANAAQRLDVLAAQ